MIISGTSFNFEASLIIVALWALWKCGYSSKKKTNLSCVVVAYMGCSVQLKAFMWSTTFTFCSLWKFTSADYKYVMWSSKISRKSDILISRYSQTKQKMSFVSYCFWHPSSAHIVGTNWPISMGFSAKCRWGYSMSTPGMCTAACHGFFSF